MPIKATLNTRRLDAIVARMDQRAADILDEQGRDVAEHVRATVLAMDVVDTGNLYNSVEYVSEGTLKGRVQVTAKSPAGFPYPVAQHEGYHDRAGRWHAGRPFMRVAIEEHRRAFAEAFRELFQ